ncbi:MAG: AAA family ATPase [Pseudomonadota bacterium]
MSYKRLLLLNNSQKSFFLWGPRQTGKTTLLRDQFPDGVWIDLLKSDVFGKYAAMPHLLREEISESKPSWVVIDEIQKVPELLDEVHYLIENHRIHFALSGSSARKVKRTHANLLGGRAHRRQIYGLSAAEVGPEFNLVRALNQGYLPPHYSSQDVWPDLASYCGNYLKEEIAAESAVRSIPAFSEFLRMAALSDTESVNMSTFARDVGVASQTIRDHYQILEDTLLGSWLNAYTLRPKRRQRMLPKFYFHDVGVVNFLGKRRSLEPQSELFGKAFENWIFHELCCYNEYRGCFWDMSFWSVANGPEVDFIVNDMELAIEAKATKSVNSNHLGGLRALYQDYPHCKRRIIVSLDSSRRRLDDGIEVWPWREFVQALWNGELGS